MSGNSQREEFEINGYLEFDPGIPEGAIDEAKARLKEFYLPADGPGDRNHPLVPYRDARRIQDAWKAIPEVKAIATAPGVIELLHTLYGRKPLPFQTLNFRVGSEQQPHSDTIHFNSKPAGFMCGVWVALEDIDRDNGPVVYWPGSHRWPEATLEDVDAFEPPQAVHWKQKLRHLGAWPRNVDADYAIYERLIRHRVEKSGIQPVYATIRKGRAFIWAANLVHGGSPQHDRARTRASQVTHFFFEGCRYYTPMLQRGWRTHWRNPEWVR